MQDLAERLRATELLKELSADEVEALAPLLTSRTVGPGEVIMRQGEPGDDLYLIESGLLEVRVNTPAGQRLVVGTRGPGEFVGEIGLLTGGLRTADVVAVSEATLLTLTREAYSTYLGHLARLESRMSRTAMTRSAETVKTVMAAERQAVEAPVELLLNRLIQHEIGSLRAAELRGESPTFDEVVGFYAATRFLYPEKLEQLQPRFHAVRTTWSGLIAGNNDIAKIFVRYKPEDGRIVPKTSVCAFEYCPGTWLTQHLVSAERHEYTGTLGVVIAILDWFETQPAIDHVRLTYRPNNPGINQLFGAAADAIPVEARALAVRDHFVAPFAQLQLRGDAAADVHVERVTANTLAEVTEFYLQFVHPVELRSLQFEDPDLEHLNRRFGRYGLTRQRALFGARRGGQLVGAMVCNLASEGMNFSFLENALENLVGSDRDVLAALLRSAVEFYASNHRNYLVGLTDAAIGPLLGELGVPGIGGKQYAVLTLGREADGIRHAREAAIEYYRSHLVQLARSGAGATA